MGDGLGVFVIDMEEIDKETLEEDFPDGRSLGRRRPGLPGGTWQGRGGVYPGEFYVEGFLVGYPV